MQQTYVQGYTQAEKLQLMTISAAIGLAVLAVSGIIPAWIVRWLTAALFATQIVQETLDDDLSFLKSPAFLLSVIAGFMYAIVPASVSSPLHAIRQQTYDPALWRLDYLNQPAEFYILAFALTGLALHGFLRLTFTERTLAQAIRFSRRTGTWLAMFSLLLTAGAFLSIHMGYAPPAVSGALRTAYPPLQSLIIVFFVYQTVTNRIPFILPAFAIILALAFFVLTAQAKPAIYIGLACGLVWLSVSRPRLRTLVLTATFFAAFLAATFTVVQVFKYRDGSIYQYNALNLSMGLQVLEHKIVWRQVDTAYCLHGVLMKHGDEPFLLSRQIFWAAALVPRAVWPDKPNFSLGSQYSRDYCDPQRTTWHSASITLLGQPVIFGGRAGIFFHGVFLFAGLAALTYTARRHPGMGTVLVMALLPWWIDFDQDFALYVANIVKFFLLMSLVAVPVLLFGRAHE